MTTTVKAAMDRAARECSITPPSSWINATQLHHVELRDDFLSETVDELLDRIDWPSPVGKVYDLTGDGSEDYSLPSDFKRLARDEMAVYETTTTRRAGIEVTSDGDWEHLKQIGSAGAFRYYRIHGYEGAWQIGLYREPSSSVSLKISYVSTLWKATSGGTAGSSWTDATDLLLLPRRLVELGVVWRFRRRKGLPYTEQLNEYEMRVSRAANDGRGRRTIQFGEGSQEFKPMRVPVPDTIPSA